MSQSNKDVSKRAIQSRHSSFDIKKIVILLVIVAVGIGGYMAFKTKQKYDNMRLPQLFSHTAQKKGAAQLAPMTALKRRYKKLPSNADRLEKIIGYISYGDSQRPDAKERVVAVKLLTTLKLEEMKKDIPFLLKGVDYLIALLSDTVCEGDPGDKLEPTERKKDASKIEPVEVKLACIDVIPEINPHWFGPQRSRIIVDIMLNLLESKNKELSLQAAKLLRECTGQKFGTNADKWNGWWGENKGRYRGFPKR